MDNNIINKILSFFNMIYFLFFITKKELYLNIELFKIFKIKQQLYKSYIKYPIDNFFMKIKI